MLRVLEQQYEKPLSCYKMSVFFFTTNFFIRNMIVGFLKVSNPRIYDAIKNARPLSQAELDLLIKRQRILYGILKAFWYQHKIEAII
jgi:hypothetical protein